MFLQSGLVVSENRAGGRWRLSQAVVTTSKIDLAASSIDKPSTLQRPVSLGPVSHRPPSVVLLHPWAFERRKRER